jgi:hypothetical protein
MDEAARTQGDALIDWSAVHGSFAEVLRGMSPPPSFGLDPNQDNLHRDARHVLDHDTLERPQQRCLFLHVWLYYLKPSVVLRGSVFFFTYVQMFVYM